MGPCLQTRWSDSAQHQQPHRNNKWRTEIRGSQSTSKFTTYSKSLSRNSYQGDTRDMLK